MGLGLFLLVASVLVPTPARAQTSGATLPEIEVVNDASGSRLQVDGRDFMVFGMNWAYLPIGYNYSYDFWNQPDDFIKAVLFREMPLLTTMGVNTIRQAPGIPPRWVEYIYENFG